MTIGTVAIEPVADPRSARQLARDTRKHEKMAQKRLTSKGATIAAIVDRLLLDDPDLRASRHVVPSARRHADVGVVDGLHRSGLLARELLARR